MARLIRKKVELFRTEIKYANYLPELINNLEAQKVSDPLLMLALCKMLNHVQCQKLYLQKSSMGESFDFTNWIMTQYKNAINVIFQILYQKYEHFEKLIPYLLKLYKRERKMGFRKLLNQVGYKDSLKQIVEFGVNIESGEFRQKFLFPLVPFLSYADIRLMILKLIPTIVKADIKHKSNDSSFNLYHLLKVLTKYTKEMNLNVIIKNDEIHLLTPLYLTSTKNLKCQMNSDTMLIQNDLNKLPRKMQYLSPQYYQEAFTSAWVALTLYQLSPKMYTKVLSIMDTDILPHIAKPMKFADFLVSSYNMGGIISILSLNGLFYLIQNQGLEYNDFYLRLYKLMTKQLFDEQPELRSRFCQQLDLFLSSTHLPAYLVASFIKRLARISLTSTPTGTLVCLALVKNLLIRHPASQVLLNTTQDNATNQHADDPFDNDEVEDLMNTKAMQSHLWEIITLQQHYSSSVSDLARKITCNKIANSAEIPLSTYLNKTEFEIYTESSR